MFEICKVFVGPRDVRVVAVKRTSGHSRILILLSELGRTRLGLRANTMKKYVFLRAVLHVAVAHLRVNVLSGERFTPGGLDKPNSFSRHPLHLSQRFLPIRHFANRTVHSLQS